jgi:hypothetical protein
VSGDFGSGYIALNPEPPDPARRAGVTLGDEPHVGDTVGVALSRREQVFWRGIYRFDTISVRVVTP